MPRRRLTSRSVVLTATFLTLAAGGVAACDATGPGDASPTPPSPTPPSRAPTSVAPRTSAPARVVEPVVEPDPVVESDDEVFYCADTDGQIVEEFYCDDDPDGNTYLFWHSTYYPRGLTPGSYLEDGEQFASGDSDTRRAFKLPNSGKISNGTIKTNVVGRGSVTSGIDSSAGG